jgi:hypothetical protein
MMAPETSILPAGEAQRAGNSGEATSGRAKLSCPAQFRYGRADGSPETVHVIVLRWVYHHRGASAMPSAMFRRCTGAQGGMATRMS